MASICCGGSNCSEDFSSSGCSGSNALRAFFLFSGSFIDFPANSTAANFRLRRAMAAERKFITTKTPSARSYAMSSLIPGWLVLFLCRVHIIHQIRIFSPSSSRGGFCFGFALGCEFCGPALFRGRFFPGLDRILGHALNSPPYGRSVLSILSGRARMMPLVRTAALRTHPDHA
jgi:hypothetical protein